MTTGVSIMKLDSEVDHGPILVQSAFMIDAQSTAGTMEVGCGQLGGDLLSQVLVPYIDGTLTPKEQDHSKATFCKKIEKSLGEIKLTDNADDVRRKFRALTPWPGIYFFHKHHDVMLRIKVTSVDLLSLVEATRTAEDIILTVIPEGKKEMAWKDFMHGYMN
jgi:methionyl-tRNA formyltransferase